VFERQRNSHPGIFTDTIADDTEAQDSEHSSSLEAATRLVDPMRFNNLTPAEITARHLMRARHIVLKSRNTLKILQNESQRVLRRSKVAAQRGQQLARTTQGKSRARQVQKALRRSEELHIHFEALHDERARFSRRLSAARDLYLAWKEAHPTGSPIGQRAAAALNKATIIIAREERITRERLNDVERAFLHMNAAKEAMLRDSENIRLDPITYKKFAGRARKRVYITIAATIFALIAILYPPWSPPAISLSCGQPHTTHDTCTNIHPGTGFTVHNNGNGILVGWITVGTDGSSTAKQGQLLPLTLLPHATRTLTCDDVASCALNPRESVHVQFYSSGGAYSITVAP